MPGIFSVDRINQTDWSDDHPGGKSMRPCDLQAEILGACPVNCKTVWLCFRLVGKPGRIAHVRGWMSTEENALGPRRKPHRLDLKVPLARATGPEDHLFPHFTPSERLLSCSRSVGPKPSISSRAVDFNLPNFGTILSRIQSVRIGSRSPDASTRPPLSGTSPDTKEERSED